MTEHTIQFSDTFKCPNKKVRLSVAACLDDYVSVNAFKQAENPCFDCKTGKEKREQVVPARDAKTIAELSLPRDLVRKKFKRIPK